MEIKGRLRRSRPGRFEIAVILAVLPAILGSCGSVSPGDTEDPKAQAAATGAAPGDTPVQVAPTQLGAPNRNGRSPEVSPGRDRANSAPSAPEIYRGTGVLTRRDVPRRTKVSVGEAGEVTLNFANADIGEVVAAVLGDTLGLSYIIDPKVQGQVTARTSRPIPRSSVISALENILELNGAALTRDDGIYKVVTLQEAATGLTAPVITPANRDLARGFGLHVIPLKYASAAGLAEVLKPFVPAGRVLRVDPARNLMIFAGTQSEARDLTDMISIFDIDWMSGMSFALFPIAVAEAEALVADLEAVFLQDGASPIAGLVRFVPIERLNSILVISPQSAYLDQARIWIERLDRGAAGVGRRLYVYHVQNGRAADLAEVLSQIFETGQGSSQASTPAPVAPGLEAVTLTGAARQIQSQTPAAGQGSKVEGQAAVGTAPGTPVQAAAAGLIPVLSGAAAHRNTSLALDAIGALGDIRIIADERNNALVILATSAEYQMIEATLKRLDITPLQVMIEVTIADVTLTDDLKYGLEWFFREGNHSATFSTVDTGAVAAAFPGFSYLLGSSDIRVALNALTKITDVKVISSPQLMVLDNQTARLQIGDQVPIPTRETTGTGVDAVFTSIQFRDTGVILEVTPRVNAGGLVVLDVLQEVSDVASTDIVLGPTIEQRSIKSTVAVQSGETIALGGLIRDRDEQSVSGVPLLSAIPILGNLFKATSIGTRRTELLVLITPRVVRDQSEARAVTQELRKRLRAVAPLEKKIAAPE